MSKFNRVYRRLITEQPELNAYEIINLTPHTVKLNDGREFPPCGTVARISTSYTDIVEDGGIPFTTTTFGTPVGVPAPREGVLYIVSGILMSALPDRKDLIAPCTNHPQTVRENGQIVSVPCFTRNF